MGGSFQGMGGFGISFAGKIPVDCDRPLDSAFGAGEDGGGLAGWTSGSIPFVRGSS